MSDTFAIGITTMNRPSYLDKCLRAVAANASPLASCKAVVIYNDGSDAKYRGEYKRAYRRLPEAKVLGEDDNHGVAYAKNRLLERMLRRTNAEWLFLLEDDILLQSPEAVTAYIDVAARRGISHLSYAHHGPANVGGPVRVDGSISYYPHSIGAWTLFHRDCLLRHGLMDENFDSVWEHVEHELRLIRAGCMLASGPMRYPDVTGSERWIREIPGSIEKSSIRNRPQWGDSLRNGLVYWRDTKPETYDMLFGESAPLYGYAQSVIGKAVS